jgi:hypothetical protein
VEALICFFGPGKDVISREKRGTDLLGDAPRLSFLEGRREGGREGGKEGGRGGRGERTEGGSCVLVSLP